MSPLDAADARLWFDPDLVRDAGLSAAQTALDRVRDMDFTVAMDDIDFKLGPMIASAARIGLGAGLRSSPRAPWASADPADSLYRIARESLNAGEYRRAAQLFAQIATQYPTSQYRADADYWRAFALYRIGGIADLREALRALDSSVAASAALDSAHSRTRSLTRDEARVAGRAAGFSVVFDSAAGAAQRAISMVRLRAANADAAELAMRIRGALAARGDATAAAQIARAANAKGAAASCDDEDAQLRVEALNALIQMDPKSADPAIAKVLARRDPCSVPLRQGAIALVGRSNDARSTDLLIATARNDSSLEVQAEAVRWLGRAPGDRATNALKEIATSSGKAPLRRIAVRALAAQQSPASSQAIRDLVMRTDIPTDVRVTALHYAGKSDLHVADLARMYDASADRSTREEIISLLDQRKEPEAADKLIDIARTSTDPAMRRRAISALSHRKDPRTAKLLSDIVDK
jgi:hypothetical protein